ncbi:MAG: alpha/beta hydrolase [Gammaproteobacteria bacterium]|nr:alpha/beta hydrolase [Gammaproteobacteria bacterium]
MNILQLSAEDVIRRNRVTTLGEGSKTLILAHGFGCDQTMWRFLSPYLKDDYKLVLFDYTGCGKSDTSFYDAQKYRHLQGYADDVIEICDALGLKKVTFVGHSVSSIIGTLAANKRPELFDNFVLVCPSPCFLNISPDYRGGFEREQIAGLIDLMNKNYMGWANSLAPLVMGSQPQDSFMLMLAASFCSIDAKYQKPFAEATFYCDHRSDMASLKHPSLILQSSNDALVPVEVGEYLAQIITQAKLDIIEANGHCLHITEPQAVYESLERFLQEN